MKCLRLFAGGAAVVLLVSGLVLADYLHDRSAENGVIDALAQNDASTPAAIRVGLRRGAGLQTRAEDGRTGLMAAAFWGDTDLVQQLLKHHVDVNARDSSGRTALMMARKASIIKTLIGAGAEVNARSADGSTALMTAARNAGPDEVRLLLAHGADASLKSATAGSALTQAEKRSAWIRRSGKQDNGAGEVVLLLQQAAVEEHALDR
jgi:uncharacterized protein